MFTSQAAKKSLGLVVVLTALTIAVTGGVLAGDSRLMLLFEPDKPDASAGDSVEIRVMGQSDGGYDGTGVGAVEFDVRYDPEAVSVTDVERGTWLEGPDTDTTVYTDGNGDGHTSVVQERDSDLDGVTGYGSVVVLTFEIAEDLEPSDVVLEFDNANAFLIDGHPLATFEQAGTITVDGGGQERDPPTEEIVRPDDGDEIPESGELDDDRSDEDANAGQSDDIPGFGILTVSTVFGGVLLYWSRSVTD